MNSRAGQSLESLGHAFHLDVGILVVGKIVGSLLQHLASNARRDKQLGKDLL